MPTQNSDLPQLQARFGERYRWCLLAAVMIGTMASVMSSTIINVAVPEMSAYFGLGQDRAQWVGSGFMLAMTVSMLTTPWLLGRFGLRRTYAFTLWLLLGGGLVGGMSNQFAWVLAARVAQGLAAGVMQPIPAIIIMHVFASGEQGRATGLFGMGVVAASALGPTVGGILAHAFGWRSIFFMVVPFCFAAMWMTRRYVPSKSADAPQGSAAPLDWLGLVLGGVAAVSLLNGLVQWRHGSGPTGPLLLLLSLLCLAGFLAWQRLLARSPQQGRAEPLVHPALFHHRRFALGCLVAVLYGVALFGSTYLLPVYMQLGLGLTAAQSGWILLPAGIALALTMAAVGRMLDHRPHYPVASLGFGLFALSLALMLTIGLDTYWAFVTAWVMVGRIGLGFVLPGMHFNTMRGLPRDLVTQGASVANFMRTLGGAAGVSVCGLVLEWRVGVRGTSLSQGGPNLPRLAAFDDAFVWLSIVCIAAMVAAWRLRLPRTGATTGAKS